MVKARLKKQTFECPDCGETLKLMPGSAIDKKEPDAVAASYACEDCNIGFAVMDGVLGYAPWDAKGERLPEINCTTCEKGSPYRQQYVYILHDTMFCEPYCPDCAVEYLRNNLADHDKREKINLENVEGMAELHHVILSNQILSDPERLKKIHEQPRMKEAMKEFGITDEQVAKRFGWDK